MFTAEIEALRRMTPRQALQQMLNLVTVLSTALMLWKGLGLVLGTESPIVVVLSGSMEPAFYRGDLLFLKYPAKVDLGDITVYRTDDGQGIPIVHRVIEVDSGTGEFLTKGDNNPSDDYSGGLYTRGKPRLKKEDIVGSVWAWLPYVGYVTIAMVRLLW